MDLFTHLPATFCYRIINLLCKTPIRLVCFTICVTFLCCTLSTHDFTFYCSDQPEICIDNPTEPVVEYTTRKLACSINGGNLSDPINYNWMYRPTYLVSDTDIPPPNGKYLTSFISNRSSLRSLIGGMNLFQSTFFFRLQCHISVQGSLTKAKQQKLSI